MNLYSCDKCGVLCQEVIEHYYEEYNETLDLCSECLSGLFDQDQSAYPPSQEEDY